MRDRRGFDPHDVFASYKGVTFAGEPLSPRARALAESWGIELFEHGNVGDVTGSFECREHDGLHFWEDTVLVEGVDDDGDRCELVATSLTNKVAPLIRYRSDDIVRLSTEPCPCGRTHARMWSLGRKSDEIIVEGRSVLPTDVWAAVETVDACAMGLFQVIRPARGGPPAAPGRIRRRRRAAPRWGARRGPGRGGRRRRCGTRRRARAERRAASPRPAAQDPARGSAMTAATDALWGVGSYIDATGRRVPWRISHDEIGRDIGAATKVLSELSVSGKGVLWCSMLSQAGQFWPYVCGTFLAGARLSCADATTGEAVRVAMFLRLMEYDAVLGVNGAILDGFDEMGRRYDDVFASVRLVGAVPGAYERLVATGIAPTRFVLCGPAVAIGRVPGGPAFVASDEWELAADGDRICVQRAPGTRAGVRAHTHGCAR